MSACENFESFLLVGEKLAEKQTQISKSNHFKVDNRLTNDWSHYEGLDEPKNLDPSEYLSNYNDPDHNINEGFEFEYEDPHPSTYISNKDNQSCTNYYEKLGFCKFFKRCHFKKVKKITQQCSESCDNLKFNGYYEGTCRNFIFREDGEGTNVWKLCRKGPKKDWGENNLGKDCVEVVRAF